MKEELHKKLSLVEKLASGTRLRRFLNAPYRYAVAIFQKKVINKYAKKTVSKKATTFFNRSMTVVLPAGTDIYLTGGKTHSSEVRLSKYMINHVKKGDSFIDVGAHFGFYSLLAANLVGTAGKVYSFEPSPSTFRILRRNTQDISTIQISNAAIAEVKSKLSFYEFPISYSEYNTFYINQFEKEHWYSTNSPEKIEITAISLDEFIQNGNITPSMIKIDVEGAEYDVIKGFQFFLKYNSPVVLMEYLSDDRLNTAHLEASRLLKSLGYTSFRISGGGELDELVDIERHLNDANLDSDNIVFKKLAH